MRKIKTLVIYSTKLATDLGLNVPERIKISYANPKFWNGVPRPIHDAVYAPNHPEIERAHEAAGKVIYREEGDSTPVPQKTSPETSQEPTANETVEVSDSFVSTGRDKGPEVSKEEDTQSKETEDAVQQSEGQEKEEQVISDEAPHWSELSWPKMRSLATQFTKDPVKSKDQAREVLLDAEAEGKI